jgi:hypothetical protein
MERWGRGTATGTARESYHIMIIFIYDMKESVMGNAIMDENRQYKVIMMIL